MQKLLEDLKVNKEKDIKQLEDIKYVRNKKKNKLTDEDLKQMLPKPKTKEQVEQEVKQKLKFAWKGSGYGNQEFNKVPVLRAKVLNEWETQRINLAERSYKAPLNYKGIKIPSIPREFGEPNMNTLPQNYQDYLSQFKKTYDDFLLRPSNYGKTELDYKLEKIKLNNKEPFRLTNSIQQSNFGFDTHSTWECEVKRTLEQSKLQTSKLTKSTNPK